MGGRKRCHGRDDGYLFRIAQRLPAELHEPVLLGRTARRARHVGSRYEPFADGLGHAGSTAQPAQRRHVVGKLDEPLHLYQSVQLGDKVRAVGRNVRPDAQLLPRERLFRPGIRLLLDRPRMGRRTRHPDAHREHRAGDLPFAFAQGRGLRPGGAGHRKRAHAHHFQRPGLLLCHGGQHQHAEGRLRAVDVRRTERRRFLPDDGRGRRSTPLRARRCSASSPMCST